MVRKGTWKVVFGRKDQSLISIKTNYTCDEMRYERKRRGGEGPHQWMKVSSDTAPSWSRCIVDRAAVTSASVMVMPVHHRRRHGGL